MAMKRYLLAAALSLALSSQAFAAIDPAHLKLTFSDEFSGTKLDTDKWNPHYAQSGVFSGEQQHYTPDSFVADSANGLMRIRADKRAFLEQKYTSGAMTTYGRFAQTYGYFEMRARLPKGQGMWPAFWLLPDDHSWPPEVDVFEVLGKAPNVVYQTTHWKSTDAKTLGQHKQSAGTIKTIDTSTGYHTYGIEWRKNLLVWYIDGVETYRYAGADVPSKAMYILANLALGGAWGGNVDATTAFPSTLDIDYVRAYQFDDSPVASVVAPSIVNPTSLSATTVKPGDTLTASASVSFGKNLTNTQVQIFFMDFTSTKDLGHTSYALGNVAAGTRVQKTGTFKVPANLPSGTYLVCINVTSATDNNWILSRQFTVNNPASVAPLNMLQPLPVLPTALSPGTSPAPLDSVIGTVNDFKLSTTTAKAGDNVHLTTSFKNNRTLAQQGYVTFNVLDATNTVVKKFTKGFKNLAAGSTVTTEGDFVIPADPTATYSLAVSVWSPEINLWKGLNPAIKVPVAVDASLAATVGAPSVTPANITAGQTLFLSASIQPLRNSRYAGVMHIYIRNSANAQMKDFYINFSQLKKDVPLKQEVTLVIPSTWPKGTYYANATAWSPDLNIWSAKKTNFTIQ